VAVLSVPKKFTSKLQNNKNMNNTQHTSAPWEIVQDAPLNPKARFTIGSRNPNGFATYVCTIRTEKRLILDGNEEANAHLIASAPELLDLLESAVARVQIANEEGNPILSAWLPDALSTLRKAKGKI